MDFEVAQVDGGSDSIGAMYHLGESVVDGCRRWGMQEMSSVHVHHEFVVRHEVNTEDGHEMRRM